MLVVELFFIILFECTDQQVSFLGSQSFELCHRNVLYIEQLKYQQLQVNYYFYNQL